MHMFKDQFKILKQIHLFLQQYHDAKQRIAALQTKSRMETNLDTRSIISVQKWNIPRQSQKVANNHTHKPLLTKVQRLF